MSVSDETLMAYVDGELDPVARAELEAAMRDDPRIEARVAQQRELRARIQLAYAAELDEAVPQRLVAAARGLSAGESNVVDLGHARSAVAAKAWRQSRWRPMASMAASLLLGVGVGYLAWHSSDSVMVRTSSGGLVAGGPLAHGLSSQLAGDRSPSSAVKIGLSFVAKSGDYCRTFAIVGRASSAGIACRHARQWEIRALAESPADSGAGTPYRTASSSLPPGIVTAVEQQISGEPLDRTAEIEARRQEWQTRPR